MAEAMRLVFNGFELDPENCKLLRSGSEVRLERRAFDLLCYLAANPERLISRDELRSEVWRVNVLSRGVLSNTVGKLRKALGQATHASEPIETVPGRGYRWRARAAKTAQPEHVVHDVCAIAPLDTRTERFVGRRQVREQLDQVIARAARGRGQLVLIAGEAGIGKTRTMRELASRAREHGFSAWEGAAHDGGSPPYRPWVEVLRAAHTELSPANWRRHLPLEAWAIALLSPELCDAPRPTQAELDLQSRRFKLFDEVTRLLSSASAERPRLVLLDDLHWADSATIELLAYAARALQDCAIVLAASLRNDDVFRDDHQAAALRRLGRLAIHIPLLGLSSDEVAELILAVTDWRDLDPRLPHALLQRTQGNPFFVRQILELWTQRGLPARPESLEALQLPPAVRDVIGQRLAALTGQSLSVLAAAAVAGPEFDACVLGDVLGFGLEDVLEALEPAWRLGLLRPHAHLHRFGFAHTLVRDALYARLTLAERGALHGKLAHVLSARSGGSEPGRLVEVAHHFLLAVPSDLDLCLQHCRRAADAARQASCLDSAITLSSRALQKLASEGGDDRTRCDLLASLAMDQLLAGDVKAAWYSLVQGAETARSLNDARPLADLAIGLAHCVDLGGGDEDQLRAALDEAIGSVAEHDTGLRAVLLAYRAKAGFDLPGAQRAALLDEADQLASRAAAPEQCIQVAQCRAMLGDPGRLEDSRRAAQRLRALTIRHPQVVAHTHPYQNMPKFAAEFAEYECALTEGDLDAADDAAARCRATAERSQLVSLAILAELMRAGRALGDGRLEDLERSVNRLYETSNRVHRTASGAGTVVWAWRSYALRLAEARGHLGAALDIDDSAYVEALQQFSPHRRVYAAIWRAWRLARIGQHDQARSSLVEIPVLALSRMPAQHGELGSLCMLADTYWELAECKHAKLLHTLLAPYAERNAVGLALEYWGSVSHYLGLLAGLLGRPGEARERFTRAALINARLRMPLQLARTRAALERTSSQQTA